MGCTLGDYKFLYGFISLVKPSLVLDIGTNHGLSAIVMAMALRDCGLDKSKILTIDIDEGFLKIADAQICSLGLSKYIDIRCCTSSELESELFFDVVFLDGDHTLSGCLKDFDNVKRRATYVLIHDTINVDDIKEAVKIIKNKGQYEALDLDIGREGEQWSENMIVYRSYPGIMIVKVGK